MRPCKYAVLPNRSYRLAWHMLHITVPVTVSILECTVLFHLTKYNLMISHHSKGNTSLFISLVVVTKQDCMRPAIGCEYIYISNDLFNAVTCNTIIYQLLAAYMQLSRTFNQLYQLFDIDRTTRDTIPNEINYVCLIESCYKQVLCMLLPALHVAQQVIIITHIAKQYCHIWYVYHFIVQIFMN